MTTEHVNPPAEFASEIAALLLRGFMWHEFPRIAENAPFVTWVNLHENISQYRDFDLYRAYKEKLPWSDNRAEQAERVTRCARLVFTMCDWGLTKEGTTYWCAVHTALTEVARELSGEGEATPPRKRSAKRSAKSAPKPPVKKRVYRKPLPDRMAETLLARGYRILGEGCYSRVYIHDADPDYVIKVSIRPDDWPAFVKWGEEKGYAGKYTPKVLALKVFKGGYYIAKIERLEYEIGRCEDTDIRATYYEMKQIARVGYADREGDIFDKARAEATLNLLEQRQPGCVAYLNDFRKKWGSDDTDLHDYNWMVRKDGTIVMTDPITNEDHVSRTDRKSFRVKSGSNVFALPVAA